MIIVAATCVGRDDELGEISRRSAATAATGADVLAVVGAPGMGKTALLREAARAERALWAQAAPWECALPGAVLRQLLQSDVPDDPTAAAAELAKRIGDEPGLILIDDAEFTDNASVQALTTLVRHHRRLPLLVVLTVSTLQTPVAALARDELRLEGLDPAAVGEIATRRGRALHPVMVESLTRHSGGNPRVVMELLDEVPAVTWTQPGRGLPAPGRIVNLVRDQLLRCGPGGRALVEALAVLRAGESLDEAIQLAQLDDPLTAIDDASEAGLLSRAGEFDVRIPDLLIRAAVIEIMGAQRTGEAHRRASEVVADPVARLHHRVAATPTVDPQLADEVDRLARQRGTEGAWGQAADLFREAARLTADPLIRDDRLTRAVDALTAAGDCMGAAAMVPAVESLRETPLRNAVLGYLAILRGRAAEAEIRLRRAWDIVNFDREPDVAAMIAQRFVLHSLVRARGQDVVDWAARAMELAGQNSPAGIEAAAIRGLGFAMVGDPAAAAGAYEKLVARLPHGPQAQRVTMGHGWLHLSQDDVDAARSNLESAVATGGMGGSSRITLWALAWLSRVYLLTGEWDRAATTLEEGRALASFTGIVLQTPLLEWTAAQLHALKGDWDHAAAAARRAAAVTQDYDMMRIATALARAQMAEAEADYVKVRRTLEPLRKMQLSGTALEEPSFWPWADVLGNAMVMEGDLDEADRFLIHHEARARAQGRRSTMARLGMVRGRLHGANGDIDSARDCFETALELLEGLPLRVDVARINFAYGQTLRRAGKRREADAALATARDLYLSLGAQTYVLRCERELKAGGLNLMRGSRDDVQLTPQEEAVTALVARGLSNREVAAELFISTKTVQYHLTRVYAKLGVRSRSELAAARR